MLIIVIVVIFGIVGAAIASSKGRNALGWFLICALFPLIGVIIVACLSNLNEATQPEQHMPTPRSDFDERWDNLAKFDPDVRAAVQRLEPHGDVALLAFKKIFSDVRDKAAIPGIVTEIENASGEARLKMMGVIQIETVSGIPIFRDSNQNYLVGGISTKSIDNARGMANMTAKNLKRPT